ncbi:MAG: hypothetical protein NXI31_15940 [bacterium]|nr:hypothetical protein [bacterium]
MFCGTKILPTQEGPQALTCPRCGERYGADVRHGRLLLTKLTDQQDRRLADGLAGCQRFGIVALILLAALIGITLCVGAK